MNAEKSEAAYHGRPRAYLVDDRVRMTRLPELDQVPGRIALVGDAPLPYLVHLANGQYVHADWLMLEPDPFASTGDQVMAKLTAGQRADWASEDPEGYFAAVRVDAEQRAAAHMRAKRGWTPTPGELGLALGIVAFIIVLFVFFVAFYPGW